MGSAVLVNRDLISLTPGRIIPRFPSSYCILSVRSTSGANTLTRCVSWRTSFRVMLAAVDFILFCHSLFWNNQRTDWIICSWLLHRVVLPVLGRTPNRSVSSVFKQLLRTLVTSCPAFSNRRLTLACSLTASLIASWSMWIGHRRCKFDTGLPYFLHWWLFLFDLWEFR